jgi:hypothetical protein
MSIGRAAGQPVYGSRYRDNLNNIYDCEPDAFGSIKMRKEDQPGDRVNEKGTNQRPADRLVP